MVKLACLVSLLLTPIALVSANPPREAQKRSDCLNDHEADQLLRTYVSFFEKLDKKTAEKYLEPDFFYSSASLNFLFDKKPFDETSPNRTDFITQQLAGQSAPRPAEKFTILDHVHSCNTIWFRWVDNSKPIPIAGFDEFYLKKDKGCWKITKGYSEFNTAAILYNAGLFPCPESKNQTS